MKWLPWRFMVRRMARAQGFLDPILLLTRLQRFSQPAEVQAPLELLRAGAVLQARGLMNSQAIQHNLDWVWPYWVERQFDPKDDAFVPRAFNITHINLTHRNWTAIGLPDFPEFPLVDPRGLVTPFFDGWSLDSWIVLEDGHALLPSRQLAVSQNLILNGGLCVETETHTARARLDSKAEVVMESGVPVCQLKITGTADKKAWLVVSLRPFNPEGVSFIHQIRLLEKPGGWEVNGHERVFFSEDPYRYKFSNYQEGDVFRELLFAYGRKKVTCDVGMATAAALFQIPAGERREVTVRVPLASQPLSSSAGWGESLRGSCEFKVPDKKFQFLYDAALRTLVLHSPRDVYPGPYTYKRFWFRDAAFILYAMLCAGLTERVERAIDRFPSKQTPFGYFLSQEGEWDSNGEALWVMKRFCEFTGRAAKPAWKQAVMRGARWIEKKRSSETSGKLHAGLFPAGFSAEHLGPADYYYWDDFWGVAGLRAAGDEFKKSADTFLYFIDKSLRAVSERLGSSVMPASPYRRLDGGSIGSLVAGYPLQLWEPHDKRLLDTADFLMKEYFVDGGFFQEISHSGINAYLTLHIAQVLLRAGDPRFFDLVRAVADIATTTGQWPEAVHPRTHGGCMGDGQHVWAAAEWVLMMRNLFVREEENPPRLILCSGIPSAWCSESEPLSFGPTLTAFGKISVNIETHSGKTTVSWQAVWHREEPQIEVHLPGHEKVTAEPGQNFVSLRK